MYNNKQNIITFDSQGFPVEKLTLRDVLFGLGGKINETTNKIEFDNSEVLNNFPITLIDDGMGYGIEEYYFTDVSICGGKPIFFREKKEKNIEKWIECNTFPGDVIQYDNKEWILYEIEKIGDKFVFNATEFNIKKMETKTCETRQLDYEEIKTIVNNLNKNEK